MISASSSAKEAPQESPIRLRLPASIARDSYGVWGLGFTGKGELPLNCRLSGLQVNLPWA